MLLLTRLSCVAGAGVFLRRAVAGIALAVLLAGLPPGRAGAAPPAAPSVTTRAELGSAGVALRSRLLQRAEWGRGLAVVTAGDAADAPFAVVLGLEAEGALVGPVNTAGAWRELLDPPRLRREQHGIRRSDPVASGQRHQSRVLARRAAQSRAGARRGRLPQARPRRSRRRAAHHRHGDYPGSRRSAADRGVCRSPLGRAAGTADRMGAGGGAVPRGCLVFGGRASRAVRRRRGSVGQRQPVGRSARAGGRACASGGAW